MLQIFIFMHFFATGCRDLNSLRKDIFEFSSSFRRHWRKQSCSYSSLLLPLVDACYCRFPSLPISCPFLCLTTCHALFYLMRVAGQRECPTLSVCVRLGLCISLLMGAWNRSKAPRHIGHCSAQTQSLPLLVYTLLLIIIISPSTFRLCPALGMCDSSQLVAHPFVPPATFISTSEPSVHQSLSSCVLLRRVTDTQRHWPQDLQGFKMALLQGQNVG